MLAGVDDDFLETLGSRKSSPDGGGFDEIGAGADDGEDFTSQKGNK